MIGANKIMKRKISIGLISCISIIAIGCGGGSSLSSEEASLYEGDGTGKNRPQEIINNPIPAPTPSSFTRQASWELSKNGAPSYHLSTQGAISDFRTIVYPQHPRLYFRDTDFTYLKSKMSSYEWRSLKSVIDGRFADSATIEAQLANFNITVQATDTDMQKAFLLLDAYEENNAEYTRLMILVAYMEESAYYINLAIEWAKHLANMTPEDSRGDIMLRRRIERLAEVYDWLHERLSDADKKVIRDGLKKQLDQLLTFDYMSFDENISTRNFIQKHSRWGDGVVAQAVLAVYGDFDSSFTKAYADNILMHIREYFRSYQSVENYVAADGGWHLGWGYAYYNANYMFNYFIWSTATSETMLDDWMGDLTYWFLYALRADKSLPQMGDANMPNMGFGIRAALYQSKFKRDGFARWYVEENQKSSYANLFSRFILSDEGVEAKSPTILPTSRYFQRSGVVIARDSWKFDEATLFIFKSSPFYNAGHHHRDENAFTIDYKTSLALDTGFNDSTNSQQYKNYYARTIAHNAITVYNPNQEMFYITDYNTNAPESEKRIVNDGGQIYKDPDSLKLEDIVEGAKNRLDGILKYQYSGNYTYALGDATKTYAPETVTLAKREVMYVEDSGYAHPVILVLDKIEATNGAFKKRYLLHTEPDTPPQIEGNKMTIVSSSSTASAKLVNLTLFPKDAHLTSIGGVGKERLLLDGSNPEPLDVGIVNVIKNSKDTKSGTWRLEVSPPVGKKYDILLNALYVDDADQNIDTSKTLLIGENSSSAIGVQFPNRVVVFSKDKKNSPQPIEYHVASASHLQHTIVTGYQAGERVNVSINGKVTESFIVGEGGCVDFKVDVTTKDSIKISQ
jgi:hypothetical protein